MTLVSIAPGEPCAVRVYLCGAHTRQRIKMVDVKLNTTPNEWEVMDLARRPLNFVAALDFHDGAA